MKIPKAIGTVRWIQYKTYTAGYQENEKKHYSLLEIDCFYDMFGENVAENELTADSEVSHYAEVIIEESKRGRVHCKKKDMWHVALYLTEEEYDTQPIEVGDIIELYDIKVHKTEFKITVFDKEKLEEYPDRRKKVKYEEPFGCPTANHGATCRTCNFKGNCTIKEKYIKTYFPLKVNDMKMSVKEGKWKMRFKNDDIWRMCCETFKLPFDSLAELRTFQEGDWFISEDEAKTLARVNEKYNSELPVVFYGKKAPIRKAVAKISAVFMLDQQKYLCHATITGERPLSGQSQDEE